jgi:putative Mg2+ transporter-C (MgtC) family protein
MEIVWQELTSGIPDATQLTRIAVRLVMAMLLGAVIGWERERTHKPAGLRTHMLVSLGSALFVLAPGESGMNQADLSRVIQGVATGIGFIGAGAILKLSDDREIKWLTTAAGLWVTSAIGVTAGLGRMGPAIIAVVLGWIVLSVLDIGEHDDRRKKRQATLSEAKDAHEAKDAPAAPAEPDSAPAITEKRKS